MPNPVYNSETLKEEYSSKSEKELVEICKRLEKSHASLSELLTTMQDERAELEAEKVQLNQTIEVISRDMSKLHIGKSNTVAPKLQEGALNFVNRMWGNWSAPKQEAVVANEHVGELRKNPKAIDRENKQVTQDTLMRRRLEGIGNKVGGVVNSVKEKAEAVKENIPDSVKQNVTAVKQKVVEQATELRAAGTAPGGYSGAVAGLLRGVSGGSEEETTRSEKATGGARTAASASREQEGNGADSLVQDPFLAAPASGGGSTEASAGSSSPSSKKKEVKPSQKEQKAAEEEEKKPKAEETTQVEKAAEIQEEEEEDFEDPTEEDLADEISSTVLIEAKIRLGDGSEVALQVRAADRCKEVAAKFVKEHSLKPTFEQPLTAYLKQCENDAEKFPHLVEADLMKIHEEYGGQ